MSLLTALGGSLAGMGIPPSALSSLTKNLDMNDILSLAIRFALIGLLGAGVRTLFHHFKTIISDALFPTAYIPASDPAFEWVMAFLAQHEGVQKQLKSFRLSTADSRTSQRDDVHRNNRFMQSEGLAVSKSQASFMLGDVVGQVVPINERSVFVNHHGAWLWVERREKHFAESSSTKDVDHIRVSGIAFQPNSIKNLLVSAHEIFFKKADKEILIFHPSSVHYLDPSDPSVSSSIPRLHPTRLANADYRPSYGNWLSPISRPIRTWKSVILPDAVKNDLLEDVREFLSEDEKEWYSARGIPHRRGYLLHGRPGAGKTTLATAVASELKLDIYVVNPAARGMDDGKLNKAFRSCPPGNMILIEDIDCVMPPRQPGPNDNMNDDDESTPAASAQPEGDPGKFGHAKSTVTLSGLLNAIDGVSSQEDCVLFASTNHPERLDDALSRPGRFDVHIAFYDATHYQVVSLFKHFYPAATLAAPAASSDAEKSDPERMDLGTAEDMVESLAQSFADTIFNQPPLADGSAMTMSMAALQGFLLKNKKDARLAEERAGEWVKGVWEGQQVKAVRRVERKKAKEEEERKKGEAGQGREENEIKKEKEEENEDDKVGHGKDKVQVKLETIKEDEKEVQAKHVPWAPSSPVSPIAQGVPLTA